MNDPRLYLFEEEDCEKNILFKEDDPSIIRGATIEKLIQRLTYDKFLGFFYNFLFIL